MGRLECAPGVLKTLDAFAVTSRTAGRTIESSRDPFIERTTWFDRSIQATYTVSEGYRFERPDWILLCCFGIGRLWLPKASYASRCGGRRWSYACHARADGGRLPRPGAAKQRVRGHHQVAPLGHPAAAGRGPAHRHHRPLRRSRNLRPDPDD